MVGGNDYTRKHCRFSWESFAQACKAIRDTALRNRPGARSREWPSGRVGVVLLGIALVGKPTLAVLCSVIVQHWSYGTANQYALREMIEMDTGPKGFECPYGCTHV